MKLFIYMTKSAFDGMRTKPKTTIIFSFLFISIICLTPSTFIGKDWTDKVGFVYALVNPSLLIWWLSTMTSMELSEDDIKKQDQLIPAAFALGYCTLILSYLVEWIFISLINNNSVQGLNCIDLNVDCVLNSFYFSVMTATTVGFGDITPTALDARLLAASQSLSSTLFAIVGLAILYTKRK
ncbi:ion channel [Burkholderia contaminans]|uniref:ion channel n=1 Tax=Burkholderia contaminans TaxID=488447 RepID=UPI001CF1749F|nr:ion channel [Burkholderia contaminans]MCA8100988.1 hypothetical protein [Burkholderia contaminans]